MNPSDPVAPVWQLLGGDPALLPRIAHRGAGDVLPARLPVLSAARTCVAVCALAAAEYAGGDRAVTVDDGAVATAFVSERQLRVDGRAPESFAPLSRMWRTADGWVRTHANYPWHRAALLSALGADASRLEAEIAGRTSLEVEDAVYAAGGLAVALRSPKEWAAHEQGAEVARRPLLGLARTDDAPAVREPGGRPRVLDLTRVIAGPVATRTLGLLGADVLRVDTPERPELPDQHADTGFGKRSALLSLDRAADRRTFEELLAGADAVVTGYRPGALDRFGLSPAALAERRPGLVVARLSAWGAYGPWAERRGFDSLVQVATGIAEAEGTDAKPGVLPAQALDHGTGYLLAAGVLRALTERRTAGGTWQLEYALAQTAHWLCGLPSAAVPEGTYESERHLAETDGPSGRLRYAKSPVTYTGGPADWTGGPGPWGADPAAWSD
uniref:CoA transferase n=1 Tax=Streptomyces polyasparticus TaxID=2767826 RepID=UPI003F686A6E